MLSPTKFNQVQEDIRKVELLNHNKTVKALEKKNREQEKNHARMITMMDRWERVVDSQANRLKNQKFEKGEQEKQFQQEMGLKEIEVKELKELKEIEVKELKEVQDKQDRQHSQELKELRDIRNETTERVKLEHDAKVHKLEEENKVLKNQLRQQEFEMGEQERKIRQEMELKEIEVKKLRDIGIETAKRVKVENDAKVHKLEEDI